MGYVGLITVCLLEGEVNKLIIGAICLVIIMFLDGNVLNPKLLSSSVKVHPLLVVAALIGGGALGGLLGMIVAVPCAALLKLQFDRYLQRKEEIKQIGEVGGEEC
jgi:predicted PurR-regulated permease PerM